MENQQDSFMEEMKIISAYLGEAVEYGLETEVVTWALTALKSDPSLSISDAMAIGYWEWVK